MQQMMAKAGGAPPEQGMNPMAAMMGALISFSNHSSTGSDALNNVSISL